MRGVAFLSLAQLIEQHWRYKANVLLIQANKLWPLIGLGLACFERDTSNLGPLDP